MSLMLLVVKVKCHQSWELFGGRFVKILISDEETVKLLLDNQNKKLLVPSSQEGMNLIV